MNDARLADLQRGLLAVTVAAAGLAFWRAALDPFNLVKATVLVVGVLALGTLTIVRAVVSGRVVLPVSPALYAAVAVAGSVLVATVGSDVPVLSVVGAGNRYTGAAAYLCYAALFVAVLSLHRSATLPRLAGVLVMAAAVAALYGLAQRFDADPLAWNALYGPVISTLGNPNFASGYLAILTPVAAWGATNASWGIAARVVSGVVAVAALATAGATGSFQGPAAAAAGLGVLGIAWCRRRGGWLSRVGTSGMAVAGVGALGVVLAGLGGSGPLRALASEAGTTMRRHYWQTALAMFADNPALGVGLDRYGAFFRIYRPPASVNALGDRTTIDAAHNVLLQLLAGGGVLVGASWIAVMGFTAWALVRGMRRLDGDALLLLGAFGGAWVAYQTQALVSLDLPALGALGWVAAGAVVVLGAPPTERVLKLPWAGARSLRVGRRRWLPSSGMGRAAVFTPVALAAGLVGLALTPMRADIAAKQGSDLLKQDPWSAVAAYRRATGLAGWEPRYWQGLGAAYAEVGHMEPALAAFARGARADPQHLGLVMSAARAADVLGRHELAESYYQQALRVEPNEAEVRREVAAFREAES